MADLKNAYGTNGQVITVTLTSLAASATAGRESTVIDNTSNLFMDALVSGKVKTQNSGSVSAPSCTYVWCYGTVDNGSTYPDTVTGSDAAITMNSPNQLRLLGIINTPAINTQYKGGPWSVAAAFGGVLPAKWGIVVQNNCGTAYTSTGTDHVFLYQGVYQTVA